MPKSTVFVDTFQVAPAQALATLLSYVAFPKDEDDAKRKRFAASTTIMALALKGREDPTSAPQPISPSMLVDLDDGACVKKGLKRAFDSMAVADAVLRPHLRVAELGKRPMLSNGEPATVDGALGQLAPLLSSRGASSENFSNLESRIWVPCRPVAHLAYEFWFAYHMEMDALKGKVLTLQNPQVQPALRALFNIDPTVLMLVAEQTRRQIRHLSRFKFREDEMISFRVQGLRIGNRSISSPNERSNCGSLDH
jgi:hypothetical protein